MFTELLNKKIYITESPSSRGRGLKYLLSYAIIQVSTVALFTRAWIEIIVSR